MKIQTYRLPDTATGKTITVKGEHIAQHKDQFKITDHDHGVTSLRRITIDLIQLEDGSFCIYHQEGIGFAPIVKRVRYFPHLYAAYNALGFIDGKAADAMIDVFVSRFGSKVEKELAGA